MTEPVAELDDFAELARLASASARPGVRAIGNALAAFVSARGAASLDDTLGLRGPGWQNPARQWAIADRDELLVRLRTGCSPYRDVSARAAGLWPRERTLPEAPSAEPARTWWCLLAADSRILGGKAIARILKQNCGTSSQGGDVPRSAPSSQASKVR
jgi:hypothetical protein